MASESLLRAAAIALAVAWTSAPLVGQVTNKPVLVGGGPNKIGLGDLDDPVDVAVFSSCPGSSNSEIVFVADAGLGQVYRYQFHASGKTTIPGPSYPFPTLFDFGPWGVATNDRHQSLGYGLVYATGEEPLGPGLVHAFDPNGELLATFFGNPASPLEDPRGIAVDSDGDVYVADPARLLVEKFAAADVLSGGYATPTMSYLAAEPIDVSVDVMDRVHIADDSNPGSIAIFENDGTFLNYVCVAATCDRPIHGIDAKDPVPHLNGTRLLASSHNGPTNVVRRNDVDASGGSVIEDPSLLMYANDPQWTPDVQGLEYESIHRNLTAPFDYVSPRTYRCSQRIYVANRRQQRIDVYTKSLDSTDLPGLPDAWWRFDRVVGAYTFDEVGSRHGTLQAPAPQLDRGVVECALEFFGGNTFAASSAVEVPHGPALDVSSTDFTIELWIRTTQISSDTAGVLDKRLGTTGPGYAISLQQGELQLTMSDGNTVAAGPKIFVADGEWHHVAFVVLQPFLNFIFVDGALEVKNTANTSLGSPWLDNTEDLQIGRGNASSGWIGFEGSLDEVSIYKDTALLSWQLEAIYEARCAGKTGPPAKPTALFPEPGSGLSTGSGTVRVDEPGGSGGGDGWVATPADDDGGDPGLSPSRR